MAFNTDTDFPNKSLFIYNLAAKRTVNTIS